MALLPIVRGKLKLNTLCFLFFFCFVIVFAGICHGNLFFRLQELSLFLPEKAFLQDFIAVPGRFLHYLGAFFLQFFYHPILGAAIYAGMLSLLAVLTIRTLRLPDALTPLAWIAPLLLILSVTDLDYIIYMSYEQEFVYSQLLGLIVALSTVWAFKTVRGIVWKTLLLAATALFLFPLAGFYALFALGWMVITSLRVQNWKQNLIIVIVGILLILLVPRGYYSFYQRFNADDLYTAGALLPRGYDFSITHWLPLAVAVGWIFLLLLGFNWISYRQTTSKWAMGASLALLTGTLVLVVLFSNRDVNYRQHLALNRALAGEEWEEMLRAIEKNKRHKPDELIIQYRNLALHKTGKMGDEMFAYSFDRAPMNRRNLELVQIAGYPLYYHYGRLNFAYRWAMETIMINGLTVDHLRYMTLAALLNGEYELADKYNAALSKTLFYRKQAKANQRFIDDPRLIPDEKRFQEILQLRHFASQPEDSRNLEQTLNDGFILTPAQNPRSLTLSLSYALKEKAAPNFVEHLLVWENSGTALPRHYQEAVLLFRNISFDPLLYRIEIDSAINERFTEFSNLLNRYPEIHSPKVKDLLRKEYGDTYWFYYFYH